MQTLFGIPEGKHGIVGEIEREPEISLYFLNRVALVESPIYVGESEISPL